VEAAAVPTELSPHNHRLVLVRELLAPAGRREQHRFIAEGPTLLDEADRSGIQPLEVYATGKGVQDGRTFVERYEAAGIPVFQVTDQAFSRISDVTTAWGLLGIFAIPPRSAEEVMARPGPVLLLAGVGDPGNAGTLVRSAEAFGAGGVLFGRGGADPYGPKVVRAAMGSLFRLPVASVAPEQVGALAAAAGRPVVATDVDGEDVAVVRIPANAVLAVGNERRGVRDWLPAWDRAVRIPQREATESLNAAVAGSIVLYEARRCQDPCQVAEKA
jgi:TrmH family RNA methyltransferase